MSGVKQYSITELSLVSQPSSKSLELTFSSLSEPLLFHCGSSDTASAIITKLESSKEAAGEALQMSEESTRAASDEDHDATPMAESKQVRWAAAPQSPATAATGAMESATVLYEFEAQGDDELTVRENEVVTVVDKENDEWWSVRNSSGAEGVVPAQYVQMNDGSAPTAEAADTAEDEARRAEEEAAAAAALDSERQREAENKAKQRRAIERAARERQRQEDEDRNYAQEVEYKEAAKAEKRARRLEHDQQQQRERDATKR